MGDAVGGIGQAVGGILSGVTGALGMQQPEGPKTLSGPTPAEEQKDIDQAAVRAREDRRRKSVLASGRKSTIKSAGGTQGLESNTTAKKTVLGA